MRVIFQRSPNTSRNLFTYHAQQCSQTQAPQRCTSNQASRFNGSILHNNARTGTHCRKMRPRLANATPGWFLWVQCAGLHLATELVPRLPQRLGGDAGLKDKGGFGSCALPSTGNPILTWIQITRFERIPEAKTRRLTPRTRQTHHAAMSHGGCPIPKWLLHATNLMPNDDDDLG